MSKGKTLWLTLLVGLFAGVLLAPVAAQEEGGRGGRGGRAGGQGSGRTGRMDPEEMRRRRSERMKEMLGATDEKWKVIEPLLTEVQTAQSNARGGRSRFMGFGGMRGGTRGGRTGDTTRQAPENTTEVGKKMAALRTLLDNTDAASADIAKALNALRDAKKKAEAAVVAAQKKLKAIQNEISNLEKEIKTQDNKLRVESKSIDKIDKQISLTKDKIKIYKDNINKRKKIIEQLEIQIDSSSEVTVSDGTVGYQWSGIRYLYAGAEFDRRTGEFDYAVFENGGILTRLRFSVRFRFFFK